MSAGKALTASEAGAIERNCYAIARRPDSTERDVVDALATLLGMVAGLRAQEVAGALFADFCSVTATIKVRPVVEEGEEGRPLKKGKVRTVPIGDTLAQLLLLYRDRFFDIRCKFLLRSLETRNRGPSKRFLQEGADRVLNRFGLKRPGRCFHCWRHTFATRFYETRTDMPVHNRMRAIKKLLGHSSLAITCDYIEEHVEVGFRMNWRTWFSCKLDVAAPFISKARQWIGSRIFGAVFATPSAPPLPVLKGGEPPD